MHTRPPRDKPRFSPLLLAAALALPLAACEEKDPSRPLNTDEGAALLRDIRSDRSRAQNLTPAEKQYLIKTLKK